VKQIMDGNTLCSACALSPMRFLVQERPLPVGTEVTVTRTNDLLRGGSRLIRAAQGGETASRNILLCATAPRSDGRSCGKPRRISKEQPQSNALTAADPAHRRSACACCVPCAAKPGRGDDHSAWTPRLMASGWTKAASRNSVAEKSVR